MDRYMKFDIEQFLKDAKTGQWAKDIAQLEKSKGKIIPLKAIGNSEVHSGHISHIAEDNALDLAEIDEKIERIKSYSHYLDMCIGFLTQDEEILIKGFYLNPKPINCFVDEYCISHNCETRTVYNRKREAVENLRRMIMETMEEGNE